MLRRTDGPTQAAWVNRKEGAMATTKKTPADSKGRSARSKRIARDLDPAKRADGIKGGLGQLRNTSSLNASIQSTGASTTSN
jgi:hypothetical protein